MILTATWQFRVNRFRGTWIDGLPCPLPEHYVLGFDEQKIETEGIPERFLRAVSSPDLVERQRTIAKERAVPESPADNNAGYPVYLNGDMRRTGWWYYYLLALLYKVPEGTWILVVIFAGFAQVRTPHGRRMGRRDRALDGPARDPLFHELSDRHQSWLALRAWLILPYLFIATGKLVPWTLGLSGPRKWVMRSLVAGSLAATIAASIWIHPHYLAYFNWASGGPDQKPAAVDRQQPRLGPGPGRPPEVVEGDDPRPADRLAYFGQINPSIFKLRGESFDWFLPPVRPGTIHPMVRLFRVRFWSVRRRSSRPVITRSA